MRARSLVPLRGRKPTRLCRLRGELEAAYRFCPWCAAPQRRKLVEFFRAHPRDPGKALRVSRYLTEDPHVRFSVWSPEGVAEAAVSLEEEEAERLAGFLVDAAGPRPTAGRAACSPTWPAASGGCASGCGAGPSRRGRASPARRGCGRRLRRRRSAANRPSAPAGRSRCAASRRPRAAAPPPPASTIPRSPDVGRQLRRRALERVLDRARRSARPAARARARTSSALIVTRRSSPVTRSRPATVVSLASSGGQAEPTSIFATSAVSWPISSLCEFLT